MFYVSLSEQKPNTAAEYVAAPLSKIHGLDWHPDNEFILATSSQDNSVRVRTSNAPPALLLHCRLVKTVLTSFSLYLLLCLCLVLGLPTAQEVPEHPVLSGAGVEGPVHGEYEQQRNK